MTGDFIIGVLIGVFILFPLVVFFMHKVTECADLDNVIEHNKKFREMIRDKHDE